MTLAQVTQLIIEYRYWILFPLSFIEGPIIAFIAGTLASLGYFNVYVLGIFFFARDMIMDSFYYAVGYYWGRTKLATKLLKKIGVEREHLEGIRTLWEHHAGRTMLFGKLSYGIASSFVVLAGTVKMPLKKFYGWGAVVAVLQFWTLLALGYFFGTTFAAGAEHIIENTLYAIGGIGLIASVYYIVTFYIRKRMEKIEDKARKE
jgi:membrane protein DedA with SNARE-associated domain